MQGRAVRRAVDDEAGGREGAYWVKILKERNDPPSSFCIRGMGSEQESRYVILVSSGAWGQNKKQTGA